MSHQLESLQRLQSPSGHFTPTCYCSSFGMGSSHRPAQSSPTHPAREMATEDMTNQLARHPFRNEAGQRAGLMAA